MTVTTNIQYQAIMSNHRAVGAAIAAGPRFYSPRTGAHWFVLITEMLHHALSAESVQLGATTPDDS
jgi:hypothetical protein